MVVELEVDPDDGFDVLCEKLEVILCDKDQVPRDNPYAVSSDPLSCHAMPCHAMHCGEISLL